MDTPERIWLKKAIEEARQDIQSILDISELACKPRNSVISTFSEYVRKDIHDAAVSKARVDALKEAARTVYRKLGVTENSIRTADLAYDTILALIEKKPKP